MVLQGFYKTLYHIRFNKGTLINNYYPGARGGHSSIPLVMALALVKMRSRVKRRLRQGSTGQEVFSDRVVKGSNGRFNDRCVTVLKGSVAQVMGQKL